MVQPKTQARPLKNADGKKESLYQSRLAEEAAALAAASKVEAPPDDMSSKFKQWRQEMLEAISDPPVAPAAEPMPATIADVAGQPQLRERLRRKKSKRRLLVAVPFLAACLYAGFYLLRLDAVVPQIAARLPWPAAYVAGDFIWLDELKQESALVKELNPTADSEALALQHLVEVKLVDKRFKEYQLTLPTGALQEELNRLTRNFGSADAFQAYLQATYGLEVKNFSQRVLLPLLKRVMLQQYLNNDPRAAADAEAKGRGLRERIEKKELSFEQAAEQASDDPLSASQGGSLGWFTWGTMVPEFELALRSLELGEISQPVRTDFGYHLIRLDEVDGKIPTKSEELSELGTVRASHILFKVVDFEPWLQAQKLSARKIYLVPLKNS
ncbi:MAG: peptidylprolyl isomerase [Candidatus Veblenbacteria bacterium]|nr:peptidylprolyl isomerase [Candidatus Veblenbacteria bacterium]